MKRKIMICISLCSLLSFVGCYSSKYVTIDEFEKIGNEEGGLAKIEVHTVDNKTYQFRLKDCRIKDDTLLVTSLQRSNYGEESIERKFAFDQIQGVKYDHFDADKTVDTVLGAAALAAISTLLAREMNDMYRWDIQRSLNLLKSGGPDNP